MSVHREENSNRPWKKSLFLYIRVYDENLNSSIIFFVYKSWYIYIYTPFRDTLYSQWCVKPANPLQFYISFLEIYTMKCKFSQVNRYAKVCKCLTFGCQDLNHFQFRLWKLFDTTFHRSFFMKTVIKMRSI